MGVGRGAWATGAKGLLLGLLAAGCPQASSFECQTDDQCLDGADAGQCTELGYCAFEDEACDSGWAYGDLAGGGQAGQCVPVGGDTGGMTDGETTASAEGSSAADGSMTGSGDDTGPVGECSPGPGTPCTPDDPCASEGVCDESGSCVPDEDSVCTDPPNDSCYVPVGECGAQGCTYVAQSREFPCDDGNSCTFDDFCDGQGACVPGPECPVSNDPCLVGSRCTPEGCSLEFMPDGTACGELSSERCCEGACVDIASSDDHCGGCNTECDDGQGCMPIDETPFCGVGAWSGRCGCTMDDDCPRDQTCTMSLFRDMRCEPQSDRQCDGELVVDELCSNYCTYP